MTPNKLTVGALGLVLLLAVVGYAIHKTEKDCLSKSCPSGHVPRVVVNAQCLCIVEPK